MSTTRPTQTPASNSTARKRDDAHQIHFDPAVRALIERERRAAAVEAWDAGAIWAAVECGAIPHEAVPWLVESDNPYRIERGDA